MRYRHAHRRKPVLSAHQKQIRFFTRISVVICALLTAAIFFVVNRPIAIHH
jgi:hypothetical protein